MQFFDLKPLTLAPCFKVLSCRGFAISSIIAASMFGTTGAVGWVRLTKRHDLGKFHRLKHAYVSGGKSWRCIDEPFLNVWDKPQNSI
jgi:hypothetical protein